MNSPDPKAYTDCVLFLRDMHKVILHNCGLLESLLADAESSGVFASFANKPEWNEVFAFFQRDASLHELDEEKFLFPALGRKVPRVGFQQANAPIHFLIQGHRIMERKIEALIHDWTIFREQKRAPSDIAASHAKHIQEDATFISNGRELVRVYKEHIAVEEERVYTVAAKALNGEERYAIMEMIRVASGQEILTSIPEFDKPQFSNPAYEPIYFNTEAQSDNVIDADYSNDVDDLSEPPS